MRRGEIRLVDFEPARSGEVDKRRPAVIVSNDAANASAVQHEAGVVTVVPLTSNTLRVLAFQVYLPAATSGLDEDSKAQAEQVRALSIGRVGQALGRLTPALIAELDEALRIHLRL